jgi:hypothetical protein
MSLFFSVPFFAFGFCYFMFSMESKTGLLAFLSWYHAVHSWTGLHITPGLPAHRQKLATLVT